MNLRNGLLAALLFCSSTAFAAQSIELLNKEGARDGKRYAEDAKKKGIKVDGLLCSIGMAAEDKSRPELTQAQIEAYARAFGNACMGRNVF